eukprot:TRINITY_DN14834_c0_g2_i6.p4 TRINITY_DN14834_c0_g2~~TRINITY_DN14834_c0_g2_i6.p4  ORF type:complete len:144 (-),score=19.51 TRINITY_DN14834_c0_g2_i6:727-1158(-)
MDQAFNVVMGVGMNLDNAEPTTCVNELLRQLAHRHGRDGVAALTMPELLAAFLQQFEDFLEVLERQGFEGLEGTYRRYWLHENQRLVLEDSTSPGEQTPVTIIGLTATGFLKGKDDRGIVYELHPDGNSLDMMKGLLRRKMHA